MRFLASRAYDWIDTPADALVTRKDPMDFVRRLRILWRTRRETVFKPDVMIGQGRPMKKVEIFTDGACKGNPGPGGWGALLRMGRHEKEISGAEADTTNNRMEMTAAIRGLRR